MQNASNVIEVRGGHLALSGRHLWKDLNLTIQPGEFIAVLGPNGSGKSSFLKTLLGQYKLDKGTVNVHGTIGYIPQQHAFDEHVPLRGRDLVQLGIDGDRWGFGGIAGTIDPAVQRAITAVGASKYADAPLGKLSGGEQQRLRVAQALVNQPQVLLCDEPLLSLDIASQQSISTLINAQRKKGTAVVFVTHEVNPILPFVDRILYLVNGKWRLGAPHVVLTSAVLSQLYGTTVDVLRVRGRIIVVAGDGAMDVHNPHHHEVEAHE